MDEMYGDVKRDVSYGVVSQRDKTYGNVLYYVVPYSVCSMYKCTKWTGKTNHSHHYSYVRETEGGGG
jgi:hypothetical protein